MKYSVETIRNLIGSDNMEIEHLNKQLKRSRSIELEGYPVYTRSLRYATFFQKGCKCVNCGKEGTYFQLDQLPGDNPNRKHLNLYCEDGTLMTKDHIRPKSKGGKDLVSNLQPMCADCNKAKGSDYDGEYEKTNYIKLVSIQSGKESLFRDVDAAVYHALIKARPVTQSKLKKNGDGAVTKSVIRMTMSALDAIENNGRYLGYEWSRVTN